jgi:hypothetical protein
MKLEKIRIFLREVWKGFSLAEEIKQRSLWGKW